MIFVSVGTHEQPFDRLLKEMDRLVEEEVIKEEVFIQTGYSTYEPKHCRWSKFLPFNEMKPKVEEAHIVITHGGPSSFVTPLECGKVPIVVPRRQAFNEHVNDHQVKFCHAVVEKQGNIIVVDEIEKLGEVIQNYDKIVADMPAEMKSNNANFCRRFESLALNLVHPQEVKPQ